MAPLSELASVVAPPTQTNRNDWKEVLVLPKNAATTERSVGMVEQQQQAGGVVINNNISKWRSTDDLPEEEEDVIEARRQRRMMKNRESAARSRAKRLAYTAKLEKELDSRKEENKKLKQIVKEYEEKEAKKDDENKNEKARMYFDEGGQMSRIATQRGSAHHQSTYK